MKNLIIIKVVNLDKTLEEYIKAMPSLPTSVNKVLEICDNPLTSPADLNHVISLDPVLVGRVLKLINSAYYGLEKPVRNLIRAIIMLGINTVKNLALSTTAIANLSEKKSSGLDLEGFWRHSLCVGVSAKLLARERGVNSKLTEEYFTAGFLHDIGKIPLNAILAKEYLGTISTADRERKPLFEAETKTLGLNHCSVGAMISYSWKLEGAIGDTIINHHEFSEYTGSHKDILYSVAVANHFACNAGIGFSGARHQNPLPSLIWETLKISSDIFDEIKESVYDEIEKAEIFLKII